MFEDIIEDFSPITAGDTGALFKPHFRNKNKEPVDLTGKTISMVMQNRDDNGDVKVTTGTWDYDDRPNGVAHFNYGNADVDTPGVWNMIMVITDDVTGKPVHADTLKLRIKPLPVVPGP
jgi:hypothetical protein